MGSINVLEVTAKYMPTRDDQVELKPSSMYRLLTDSRVLEKPIDFVNGDTLIIEGIEYSCDFPFCWRTLTKLRWLIRAVFNI